MNLWLKLRSFVWTSVFSVIMTTLSLISSIFTGDFAVFAVVMALNAIALAILAGREA